MLPEIMDGITLADFSLQTMSLVMDGVRGLAHRKTSTQPPRLILHIKNLMRCRHSMRDYLLRSNTESVTPSEYSSTLVRIHDLLPRRRVERIPTSYMVALTPSAEYMRRHCKLPLHLYENSPSSFEEGDPSGRAGTLCRPT